MIILTGPPAAGKTTVAELITSDASGPTVHLTTDLFYRAIRTGFVLPYLPEAARQNEVVIDAIIGLHGASTHLGELESHAIDTGHPDTARTVVEVRHAIESGRYRLA